MRGKSDETAGTPNSIQLLVSLVVLSAPASFGQRALIGTWHGGGYL